MTTDPRTTVAAFDRASAPDATALLQPCCASTRWATDLVAGRPYGDLAAVAERSDDLIRTLDAGALDQALAAHPRIGDRVSGDDTESAWSRQEQSATADLAGTGKSAEEMLAAARSRLENPPEVEREVVRRELAAIVRLRLAKALV